jgi:predicted nucleotidyltransferase
VSIEDENYVLESLIRSFLKTDEDFHLRLNEEEAVAEAMMEVEWLQMQHTWRTTKQLMIFSEEIENEITERRRWSQWAIHAAEMERQRRMRAMKEIDDENDRERKARAKWAIEAIEHERNERVYHQFLMSLTSTNWFNETISSHYAMEDYEVVCPYYKLGCTKTCKRSNLEKHLQDCQYTIDCYVPPNKYHIEDYEVVCPNTVLGCTFTGDRSAVMKHLQSCRYSHGQSKEQEYEERLQVKNLVISECEVERLRRVTNSPMGDKNIASPANGGHATGTLHNLLRSQINEVLGQLHDQVLAMHESVSSIQSRRLDAVKELVVKLESYINRLWPFTRIEIYGSYSTALHAQHSDLDLVICFSDEYESLSKTSGSFPLLHVLADFLQREAKDLLVINTVILNARVPVIKAVAISSSIAVDISIDSPMHSGIATASMVRTLVDLLPPLRPIVTLLKAYLRSHGLMDAYYGGMSSYGLTLLCLIPILKHLVHRHKISPSPSTDNMQDSACSGYGKVIPKLALPTVFDQQQQSSCPSSSQTSPRLEDSSSTAGVVRSNSSAAATTVTSTSIFPMIHLVRSRSNGAHPADGTNNNKIIRSPGSISVSSSTELSQTQTQRNRSRHNSWTSSEASYRSASTVGRYQWTNISLQKEYGRKVALKLVSYHGNLPSSEELESLSMANPSSSSSSPAIGELNPLLSIYRPLLGEILEDILHEYGEEMEIGVHGFSARNGGFRFDVNAKKSTSACSHPHASDPIVIEDPVNVINNVGSKCYKAAAIQRLFLDAHDRFKSFAVRYNSPLAAVTTTSIAASSSSIVGEVTATATSAACSNPGSNRSSRRFNLNATDLSSDSNNNNHPNILQEIFGLDLHL